MNDIRVLLDDDEMPRRWYNIQADLPVAMDPPLNPKTMEPATPEDLLAIFPKSLVMQETNKTRYIDNTEAV